MVPAVHGPSMGGAWAASESPDIPPPVRHHAVRCPRGCELLHPARAAAMITNPAPRMNLDIDACLSSADLLGALKTRAKVFG
jgi:hypothetical protein